MRQSENYFRQYCLFLVWILFASVLLVSPAFADISFSASTYSGNEDTPSITVTVSRTGTGAVTVDYNTVNISAVAGFDYTETIGTLSWPAGDSSDKTFDVPLIDDTLIEGDQTFQVALSNATGSEPIVAPSTAIVTIVDIEAGRVQLTSAGFSADEDAGTVTITASRTNGTSGNISVSYSSADGTAVAGSDYTASSGTLNWADGDSANKSFTVPILDDRLLESAETFSVSISAPTNDAELGTQTSATVSVNDIEEGDLDFSAPSYSVDEDGGSITITVTRSNGSDRAVSVVYSSSDGTANSGADYTGVANILNWSDGDSASKTFTVPILDDALVEGDETFALGLSSAGGGAALGSQSSATVTIADTEPSILKFNASTYSVNEDAGSVTISVSRTGGSNGAVTVNYATNNGSAVAGSDFTAVSGTLSWADGDSALKTFTVPILDDTTVESNESIVLLLSSPTGGAVLGTPSSAPVTIVDIEPGILNFTNTGYSADENDGTLIMTVSRSNGTTGAVSVSYSSSNGSATAGADYTAVSGTLSWTDGESTNKSFAVPIFDDVLVEGNENFSVSLSSPAGGATLGTVATATGTIIDIEAGQLQFTSSSYSVDENGGSLTISVSRVGGDLGAISVDYGTTNISATSGVDFGLTSGTLNWADGETADKSFVIPINDDNVLEGDETFTVNLSSPTSGASLGAIPNASVTIVDQEAGTLAFNSGTYVVDENGVSLLVTVTRSSGSDGAVAVNYASSDGTASSPADYTAVSGTLNWSDGDTADKSFSIPVFTDALVEGNETFSLSLSTPTGGSSLGAQATATVTINDIVIYGSLRFSASSYTVNENDGTVTIAVERVGGSGGAVSVAYTTANVTAASGFDYTATSGTLSWADGDAADKTFSIAINDDSVVEGNEVFNVVLTSPSGGASLGLPNPATINIIDFVEYGTLQLSAASYTIDEDGANATITFTRLNGNEGAVSLNYSSADISAIAGSDYTAVGGTLNWADGDATSQTINVPIAEDFLAESDESFAINIDSVSGGASLGAPASATVTISNVAAPGVLSFNASSYTVTEDDGSLTVTVTRTNGSEGAIAVIYSTSDGSAVAGNDYTAVSGSLSWANGETASKTFTVPVNTDLDVESDETIQLQLSSPSGGATLGSIATATVTLQNTTGAGALQFVTSSYTVDEVTGELTVEVARVGAFDTAVTVDYASSDGSAVAGSDYTAVSGTLSWGIGDSSIKQFTVSVTEDVLNEVNETFTITLSNPTGFAVLGTPLTTTVTINDVLIEAREITLRGKAGASVSADVDISAAANGLSVSAIDGSVTPAFIAESSGTVNYSYLIPADAVTGAVYNDNIVWSDSGGAYYSIRVNIVLQLQYIEGLTPEQRETAAGLDDACDVATGQLVDRCDELSRMQAADVIEALEQIAPKQFVAQAEQSLKIAATQFANINSRLVAIRRGERRVTFAGLSLNYKGFAIPFGVMLDEMVPGTRGDFPDDKKQPDAVDVNKLGPTLEKTKIDGPESLDPEVLDLSKYNPRLKDADRLRYYQSEAEAFAFFVSGQVDVGEQTATSRQLGYDLLTTGVTLGGDYRFNEQWVLGGALGFANTETDFNADAGEIKINAASISSYANFSVNKWFYVDMIGSVGQFDYDMQRKIVYTGVETSTDAKTDALWAGAALSTGLEYSTPAWHINPFIKAEYTYITIDEFSESGGDGLALHINEQSIESLRAAWGLQASLTFSGYRKAIIPSISIASEHEMQNNERAIRASFIQAPSASFRVLTEEPDRDYLTASFSISMVSDENVSAFIRYTTTIQQDNYRSDSLGVGAQFAF